MKKYFKENKKKFSFADRQKGSAMLIAIIFFLFISLAIISGLVSPSIREFKNANTNLNSKKSFFLSESGSEDTFYRILKNKLISENETIVIDSNSVSTTITTLLGSIKQIISLGDVSSYQRKNNLTLKAEDVTGSASSAGSTGLISNMRVGYNGAGDARANTVRDSTVTGVIYCQTGSGNNSSCDTSQANPVVQDFPISDLDIAKWENDATSGGTTNGNLTILSPTTIGPRKIEGNLTVSSFLTVSGTIYVTGNIIINGTMKLSSSYGATSAVIVSEGYIIINNGAVLRDSGTFGSYMLLLSKSGCDASILESLCNGNNAIQVSNNSNISIINAQKGTVYFSNNASVKEVVGHTIFLKNNVGINYSGSVVSANFTSESLTSWIIDGWGEE